VAEHRFNQDYILYALMPHMHLRAKSFCFEATYPDGRSEVVLDVPRYEFDWQNAYTLDEPKPMPEGTIVRCLGRFDNSAGNPYNPDLKRQVTFGEQTNDEMLIGYMDVALDYQHQSVGPPKVVARGDGRFDVTFRHRAPQGTKTVHLAASFHKDYSPVDELAGPDQNGFFTTTVVVPSLDVLLATPLPTATIVRGKWRWAFWRVPLLTLLPTVMTMLLTAVGRWAGPLLMMALILAQGAAVTSVGLALATWIRRAGGAPALCASACLGMSLGWPVLIFFLFAGAPRDDWFPYWVMMGSPVASMTLLTRVSIAPCAVDASPGVALAALCWTAAYAAAAGTLFGLTLFTFDGCLGRIPRRRLIICPSEIWLLLSKLNERTEIG
jgi:hypothetical protein